MTTSTYVATFKDGETATRKTSGRAYAAAWRVTNVATGEAIGQGFSGSRRLAESSARRLTTSANCRYEVADAALAPEGYERQLKAANPWRLKYQYPDGRKYFVKKRFGNEHERFPTKEAAEARAAVLVRSAHGRAVTYFPVLK